jgi:hypothetical protein
MRHARKLMVVPYKVNVRKIADTDTQVKKYLDELSKSRSFRPPGEINYQVEYVKKPPQITQTTVYNSLQSLVKELQDNKASAETINETKDSIKNIKTESAVNTEPYYFTKELNDNLITTIDALHESTNAISDFVESIRNGELLAFLEQKQRLFDITTVAKNNNTDKNDDENDKINESQNYNPTKLKEIFDRSYRIPSIASVTPSSLATGVIKRSHSSSQINTPYSDFKQGINQSRIEENHELHDESQDRQVTREDFQKYGLDANLYGYIQTMRELEQTQRKSKLLMSPNNITKQTNTHKPTDNKSVEQVIKNLEISDKELDLLAASEQLANVDKAYERKYHSKAVDAIIKKQNHIKLLNQITIFLKKNVYFIPVKA